MRKLYLFVMLSVLSCALFVQTAHADSVLMDQPTPMNPESVNALPGEKTYPTGYIPSPIDRSHLKDNPPILQNPNAKYPQSVKEITIPAKYDMRKLNRLPAVRTQSPWGTCWAHAAIGSLESIYMTQNSGTTPDLSEFHLAYFTYGDTRPGKSFSMYNSAKDIMDQGGNNDQAISFLSRLGTVNESSLPYPNKYSYKYSYAVPDKLPEDYPSSGIRLKEVRLLAGVLHEQ
mgnify:CR=1 FL=1